MSGAFNQSQKGWKVFVKKTGGGSGQLDKYDNTVSIIVANSKKPAHLYLSKLALRKLGNPTHIIIQENGSEVGFFPASPGDDNAYVLARAKDKPDGHQFLNCRAAIKAYKLKSGVYTGVIHDYPPNKIVVINSNDPPSQL